MKDIVIIGAGGFCQEVLHIINEINKVAPTWKVLGFASEVPSDWGKKFHGYNVVKVSEVKTKCVALGFGSPIGKFNFVKKYKQFQYPNLIHPKVEITLGVKIDPSGIIIAHGTSLMPCSHIKNFVTINVHCVVGHDTIIDEYATLSPGSLIMGNSYLGKCSYFGVGASTREKTKIGNNCVIGANAAVVSDIPDNSMAVGVPAKVIKKMV